MPEKTKPKEKDNCKTPEDSSEENEPGAWSRDQREKSYYYDDAHGYEIYNPDEDEEED